VTPLVEVVGVRLGVKDEFVVVAEAAFGPLEALEAPCTTGLTASSESAARGLVERNEADVGLLGAVCVVPSVPDAVVEVADAVDADAEGSDVALEDPAVDGLEPAESVPWVLAEALPPGLAELYPEGEAELPDVGAGTPGLALADGGIVAAVAAEDGAGVGADAAMPAAAGTDEAELGVLAAAAAACCPLGAATRTCAAVAPIG
jgi:hypothetical protein